MKEPTTLSPPRRWLPATLLLLLLLPITPLARPFAEDPAAVARQYLSIHAEGDDFSGAVLLERAGEALLRTGFGLADREHGVANTPETHFRIGSISKMFAAALAALLQERGDLDLDDPLEYYFDDIPDPWKEIRLVDLLMHRSGILDLEEIEGYRESMVLPTRPRETMRRFYSVPLRFAPDSSFEYSSSGYVILAAVIERVCERDFEELLRELVLDPLELHDTGHDRSEVILPHRARGYVWGPAGIENAPYIHMDLPIGGGELYSTVDDLARWARSLERGALLDGDALLDLFTPREIENRAMRRRVGGLFGVDLEEGGYANGWAIGTQHGRLCRQHGGVINGFSAYLARFPEEDATVVVLGNTETYDRIVEIAVNLAAILFGEEFSPPAPPLATPLPEELLQSYVGVFELREGVDITITRLGNQLQARIVDDPVAPIFPRSPTEFYFKTQAPTITFRTDESGAVEGILFRIDERRAVPGKRKR
jgi:CubicO group peptidase (beta-lactamase class C family)